MSPPDAAAIIQPGCPVCNRPLGPTQSWCLECGAAARTRIAPTPRWRPLALVAGVAAVLAIVAIGFAIARLVRGPDGSGTVTAPLVSTPPGSPTPQSTPTVTATPATPTVTPTPTPTTSNATPAPGSAG